MGIVINGKAISDAYFGSKQIAISADNKEIISAIMNLYNKFANNTATTLPAYGNKAGNMAKAYCNCQNLNDSNHPYCGNRTTDMYETYYYCTNLTGKPACGDNVVNMSRTYLICPNLTGNPVCGPNVTNMYAAYSGCNNLTGSPVCGPNVTNMSSAYEYCYNLTGGVMLSNSVTNISYTFYGCSKINGVYVPNNVSIANMINAFAGRNYCTELHVVFGNSSIYNNVISNAQNIFGCSLDTSSDSASMISIDNKSFNCIRTRYNVTTNTYIHTCG